jgi:hypothetical protein
MTDSDPYADIADMIDNGNDFLPTAGDSIDQGDGALPETPKGAPDAPGAAPRSWGFDVKEINRSYALAIWGGKAVVVNEQPCGPANDRIRIMTLDSMTSWFANRFTEVVGADGKPRVVNWAQAWHRHRDRRSFAGVEFFPDPACASGTLGYLNLWRGFSVAPSETGSWDILKDHLTTNVCQGNYDHYQYLFGWMAHLVQKPRERPGIALVLRGRKGTGKTKVGEVLGSLFAPHYFPVDDARYLTGQFNTPMSSCLVLQADEAMWAGDKTAEGRLKGLITSRIQMIESKGVDPIRMENRVRVIMTSNEGWVVPATGDERRFCVLDVGSLCERNNKYFRELDEQLDSGGRERFLHDLLSFDLSKFDIWRIPQTQALLDQKVRSLDPIDDFWYNRLWEGTLLHGDSAWRERVVKADLYAEYLKDSTRIGIGRKRNNADFGKRLIKLVPGIRESRPAVETEQGIVKRLWSYDLPSLRDCRAAFDETLGQPIDWPALSPGEGERAQYDPADEQIPV